MREDEIPTVQAGPRVVRILGSVENLMPDSWTGASLRPLKARGARRDEYPDWDPSYTLADIVPSPYGGQTFDVER